MHYALCTMHYALCTMRFALCTLHFALCTCTMHMHFALCTLNLAPWHCTQHTHTHQSAHARGGSCFLWCISCEIPPFFLRSGVASLFWMLLCSSCPVVFEITCPIWPCHSLTVHMTLLWTITRFNHQLGVKTAWKRCFNQSSNTSAILNSYWVIIENVDS